MKTSLVYLVIIFVALLMPSCRELNVPDAHTSSLRIASPIVRDGYLVFPNYKEFLNLIRASQVEQNNVIASWATLSGFTSLEKAQLERREQFLKESSNNYSQLSSKNNSELLSVSIPVLDKLVNQEGIIVVEDKLLSFSMKYVKILTEFNGSKEQINHLIASTESDENKGLYVNKVEIVDLKLSQKAKGARAYNSFQATGEGNDIPFYYADGSDGSTGFGITAGHVRGFVNGVRTNYPVDFCPGPNGTYVCGWDYSFSVHANGDFYVPEVSNTIGGVSQNVSIVWNTDRGSGGGSGSVAIISSGSGRYGIDGVTPFSDIEGTVTFSIPVTTFNLTRVSTVTVSL